MSTFTTNLNIEEPAHGADANTWDVPANANYTLIDQAFGTSTTQAFTNANVTFSVTQAAYYMIICTGTLSGNVQLILPGTIGGTRQILNQCTGAFTLSVLNGAGDTGGGIVVPQGIVTPVILTAGRAYFDNYAAVPTGTLYPYAGASVPPGFLLCYGQAVSQTTYAALYAALGTTWGSNGGGNFTLPDFRGRILAGADNMGGSSAGRLTGYTLAVTGGEQTHTLITSEMPSHNHTDSGHTHTVSDSGHTHASLSGGNFIVTGSGFQLANSGALGTSHDNTTASATTGVTVNTGTANIQNTGGGGAHNNIQPTAAVNYMIRY